MALTNAVVTTGMSVVATALIIAIRGPLDDGVLRPLIDARDRATLPEAVHACPPSDPCTGSGGGYTWADIGFISAAASPGPSWSSMRYV